MIMTEYSVYPSCALAGAMQQFRDTNEDGRAQV